MIEKSSAIFKTERLNITPYKASDREPVQALYSNPLVRRYMSDGKPLPDEMIDDILRIILEEYRKHPGLGRFAVFHNDIFIGQALLFYWDNDPRCELGYALLPKYWGKGFGTELSKGILKYAREQNKLNELVATVHRKNKASIKILKCCGFQFKRVVRKHGRQKDLYVNNA